jgi:hypothetical protein
MEHRMQFAGRDDVAVPGDHVVELVRVVARNIRERLLGEALRDVGGQRGQCDPLWVQAASRAARLRSCSFR